MEHTDCDPVWTSGVGAVIAFKLDSVGGKCGKEQVLITHSTVLGFTGRCCVLLGGAAAYKLRARWLFIFCWIVVKADQRHRKRWVDMTQLLLVDNSKILHLAFFPNPERQMVEWPDPTLFFYARFKMTVYVAHFLGIIAKPVTLCFLIGIIFACRLKKVKIPNSKQQFTAAICLSKGCPDYPRWKDSFQQRLIKNFNSSTLDNSLYCTVAPRTRSRFFLMSFLILLLFSELSDCHNNVCRRQKMKSIHWYITVICC